jgi:hypothetical protein
MGKRLTRAWSDVLATNAGHARHLHVERDGAMVRARLGQNRVQRYDNQLAHAGEQSEKRLAVLAGEQAVHRGIVALEACHDLGAVPALLAAAVVDRDQLAPHVGPCTEVVDDVLRKGRDPALAGRCGAVTRRARGRASGEKALAAPGRRL